MNDDSARAPDSGEEDSSGSAARLGRLPEALRRILADLRLPKEASSFIAQQAGRTRDELYKILTREVRAYLRGVDAVRELKKALTGLKLVVKAEVHFEDAAGSPVTVQTKIERTRAPKPEPAPILKGRTRQR